MTVESVFSSIFTPEGRDNPYLLLAELRRTAPVHYEPAFQTYFLTRFADCQAVLTSPDFLAPDLRWCEQELPDWREHPAADFFYSSMLRSNGRDHERLRRLVGGGFGARRVAAMRPAVEEITDRLLDDFADATSDGGSVNFQEAVGYPLPVAVVGELIGVPRQDQERFHQFGADASRLLEPVRGPEDWRRADHAVTRMREYFADLVARRRQHPADDLTTALLGSRGAGEGQLTEAELIDTLVLVFVAGFETTASLLGLTVYALLTHPDQAALLTADPDLVPNAVEETLRWDTPVQMTERIAARPVEIGGVSVPEGANVTTVLAAANRDPERHPEPDTFSVRRPDIRVLSFSGGPHYCLGAALARMEGATLTARILTRFPELAPARTPVRRASISLRSFDDLSLVTTGCR